MKKTPALFSWSGGKDSSLALNRVLKEGKFKITGLLTTVNATFGRITMHGIKESLLEEQARSIGLPLIKMYIREGNNEEYERNLKACLEEQMRSGTKDIILGDIFLEDLREYREKQLKGIGMKAHFPLWKEDTSSLAKEFVEKGFRAVTCSVEEEQLGEEWVGKELDEDFFEGLPATVDPCGENGEFHSFVYDAPFFQHPIQVDTGDKLFQTLGEGTDWEKGFWYIEVDKMAIS